jgi:hypothetical protein
MGWLKNIGSKVVHGLVPALGAALPFIVTAVTGGHIDAATVVKAAGGAFVGYMCKPARPGDPAPTP